MDAVKLHLRGKNVEKLIPWMKENFQETTGYPSGSGDIRVFTRETYYVRVGSNLLTVVILDFRVKYRCHVLIISGGGSGGAMSITWGSESAANAAFISTFRDACRKFSLVIEELPPPKDGIPFDPRDCPS